MSLSLYWIDLCNESGLTDAEQLQILSEFHTSQLKAFIKPMLKDERSASKHTEYATRNVFADFITPRVSRQAALMSSGPRDEPLQREITEYEDGSTLYGPWITIVVPEEEAAA